MVFVRPISRHVIAKHDDVWSRATGTPIIALEGADPAVSRCPDPDTSRHRAWRTAEGERYEFRSCTELLNGEAAEEETSGRAALADAPSRTWRRERNEPWEV